MRGALIEVCAWWAVLSGFTVVAIDAPGPVELAVAGAAALGAAVVAHRMRRAAGVRPRGASGAVRALLLLPFAAVRGCVVLVRAVARPGRPRGRFQRVRLRAGADPGWAGLVLGWSADTCVVDLPDGPPQALLHRLPGVGPGRLGRLLTRSGGGR